MLDGRVHLLVALQLVTGGEGRGALEAAEGAPGVTSVHMLPEGLPGG